MHFALTFWWAPLNAATTPGVKVVGEWFPPGSGPLHGVFTEPRDCGNDQPHGGFNHDHACWQAVFVIPSLIGIAGFLCAGLPCGRPHPHVGGERKHIGQGTEAGEEKGRPLQLLALHNVGPHVGSLAVWTGDPIHLFWLPENLALRG